MGVACALRFCGGSTDCSNMPQRKDPDIPVRQAMIIVPWQGTSAEQVEQLVTKKDRAGHCPESMGNGDQEHFPDRIGDGSV